MTEALLFIVIGGIAIAAAAMMLLSENTVHSALFLIVNFACVAFLYLMLNASFLAIVQIAVYAGAIMVLFLFVIMLLGAETATEPIREFRWLTPVALVLVVIFLLAAGLGIIQGRIDLQGPLSRPAMLRIVHAAPDAGAVDVYVNGELIAQNVGFRKETPYREVMPGQYEVSLTQPGTTTPILSTTVNAADDPNRSLDAYSVLAYGTGANAALSLIPDNLETTEERSGRMAIFNAYETPISLVNFGSETDPTDDRVIANEIAPGTVVELPAVRENTDLRAWAFVEGNNTRNVLFRLNNPEVYRVERDQSQLLVFTGERIFDGTLRPVAHLITDKAASSFGGPHAIGELLLTRYMLPFQVIAILLLVAMIGAIVLTHKESFRPRRRDVRRRVVQPLTSVISEQVGRDILNAPTNGDQPRLPAQETEQPEPAGD